MEKWGTPPSSALGFHASVMVRRRLVRTRRDLPTSRVLGSTRGWIGLSWLFHPNCKELLLPGMGGQAISRTFPCSISKAASTMGAISLTS